jgi:enamine deaminase RidA (YjgF/YER057c/UK114 family)
MAAFLRQSEKEKWAMKIEVVKSGAPRPLANYSEATVAGPWIFAAGQLASDFKTGVPAEARKHPNFPF